MKLTILFISCFLLSTSMCHRNSDIMQAQIHANEAYGPYSRNKMDVFIPLHHDTTTATIVLIHGGAWIVGNKSNWPADIINGLLKQGYAVSCINYRYACGDFRKQMEDIKMATAYINAKSNQWGTGTGKLGLAGVSAGGHLALLYAHAYDSAHCVKAVVSLCGPTNLADRMLYRYLQHYGLGFCIQRFLGAGINANPKVYKDASPIFNYSRVPTLFMNGQKDDLVPAVQAFSMHDTLKAYGIPTDTIVFANAGHYIFGPANANDAEITGRMISWMHNYLH